MWVTEMNPADADEVEAATARLRDAERQLTDYRTALHDRIDKATTELIERYRREPTAALAAMDKPHRRSHGGP
jgi:uncharacterized membrane protein